MNNKEHLTLPPISVVVIGLNVEKFLPHALDAIFNSSYPQNKLEIIYVDSGSTDNSRTIARGFPNVKVVELHDSSPNAAKGRNAGFNVAKYDLIHFVDADSYLDPQWLQIAAEALREDTGAVAGLLVERRPNKNFFHRMANLEWNLRVGNSGWSTEATEALTFGGNVLMKRTAYESVKGYDASMIAGEDPDLSYRIRHQGFRILRLNTLMASHDINITSWRQYLKRTIRSGVAYATLASKYWSQDEKFMLARLGRIVGGVIVPQLLILAGSLTGHQVLGTALALVVALRLLFKTSRFQKLFNISRIEAIKYALYLAFSIYPQFIGVVSTLGKAVVNMLKMSEIHTKGPLAFNGLTPLYEERKN